MFAACPQGSAPAWKASPNFSQSQGPPLCLVVVKKIRSKSLSVLSFFEDLLHCWDSLAQGLPALSEAGTGSGVIPQWADNAPWPRLPCCWAASNTHCCSQMVPVINGTGDCSSGAPGKGLWTAAWAMPGWDRALGASLAVWAVLT